MGGLRFSRGASFCWRQFYPRQPSAALANQTQRFAQGNSKPIAPVMNKQIARKNRRNPRRKQLLENISCLCSSLPCANHPAHVTRGDCIKFENKNGWVGNKAAEKFNKHERAARRHIACCVHACQPSKTTINCDGWKKLNSYSCKLSTHERGATPPPATHPPTGHALILHLRIPHILRPAYLCVWVRL
jgi:hypothetical protein